MYPPENSPALDSRLQAIRKTTVAFASLFKDIPFIKYDQTTGNEIERIKVPIIYGNKEKYVKRLDIPNEKVQITLPRIEYGLINMLYDPSRRTNQANKIVGCSSNKKAYINSPLPYNFNFEIVIYTRNIEDANQIMEYILPFFYPDYNLKLNFVPEVGIIKNVPITYNGESEEEDSTGYFDSPIRSVFRTLNFLARSYIFQSPKYMVPILQSEIYINNGMSLSSNPSVQIVANPNPTDATANSIYTTTTTVLEYPDIVEYPTTQYDFAGDLMTEFGVDDLLTQQEKITDFL